MSKLGKGFEEQVTAPYQADGTAHSTRQSITLSPDHQRWVEQAIADGRFESADDAVMFALDHVLPSHHPAGDEPKRAFTRDDYVRAAGPYADLVCELVESGAFEHPADVVLEGLALLDEHEQTRRAMDAKLKAAIQVGIDQADRGELIPAEEVFARLRARLVSKAGT